MVCCTPVLLPPGGGGCRLIRAPEVRDATFWRKQGRLSGSSELRSGLLSWTWASSGGRCGYGQPVGVVELKTWTVKTWTVVRSGRELWDAAALVVSVMLVVIQSPGP